MGLLWPVAATNSNDGWHESGAWAMRKVNSGVRVNEAVALQYSAVWCATRVITETLANLPLQLIERTGERERKRATEHRLHKLMQHPNPEQYKYLWMDQQVPLQLNWGNSYSEIQRRSSGAIDALWPIHPSRIPFENIRRNSSDPARFRSQKVRVGQPGQLVYYVKNDDHSETPIPADDVLHVPG